jgi:TPP-dependent pyruvate/acetoin dehydrogenase alpha subunit
VFVIQNNQFAESTPRNDHQKVEDLSRRAEGYGIDGYTCDGNDVFAVYETASKAIKKARTGGGPSLINALTYRILGHYVGDSGTLYRDKKNVEEAKKRDPVANFRAKLIEMKALTEKQIESIERDVGISLEEAVTYAKESPEPPDEDLWANIYS